MSQKGGDKTKGGKGSAAGKTFMLGRRKGEKKEATSISSGKKKRRNDLLKEQKPARESSMRRRGGKEGKNILNWPGPEEREKEISAWP